MGQETGGNSQQSVSFVTFVQACQERIRASLVPVHSAGFHVRTTLRIGGVCGDAGEDADPGGSEAAGEIRGGD